MGVGGKETGIERERETERQGERERERDLLIKQKIVNVEL